MVDSLFQSYQEDPSSVDADWRAFFAGFQLGLERYEEDEKRLTRHHDLAASGGTRSVGNSSQTMGSAGASPVSSLQERVDSLIYAYKDLGHTACDLDPLNIADIEQREELDRLPRPQRADLDGKSAPQTSRSC